MDQAIFIFQIIVLIFSIIVHEISHGYTAEHLGDPTARLAGRLTFNPVKHIDLFGSIIVPGLFILGGQPAIGWAKPVPYNPYNLKNPRRGGGLIALAGPGSNLLIAAVVGGVIRFLEIASVLGAQTPFVVEMLSLIVATNIVLALFNLLPIPPIDGEKILALILPRRWQLTLEAFWARIWRMIQENLILSLILFLILFQPLLDIISILLMPAVKFLFAAFTGLAS